MSYDNKRLKIAMLGQKHIPSREGGIEVVVEELSTRMAAKGHSVTCFNRKGHHVAGKEFDNKKQTNYNGVHLVNVLTIDYKGLSAITSSIFGAARTALGFYDIVHFHAEGPSFMCWLPKIFKKKIIVTIHGLDWQRAKWGRCARWYIKNGERNAVKYADIIIVLSENVKEYFQDKYGRKTVFIPNGVNRPVLRKAKIIKEKWGLQKDSYILFLGRLVPEKGVHYLIQAFKEIDSDKKLVIAGGSSDSNGYINSLRELAGKNVVFTGFIQGEELYELYSNAYLYVLPSDIEGMPLSLLEAMSYGNCCLVSSISECISVVEDKAVVFEKSNVADLKTKLEKLVENKNLVEKYKATAAGFICNKYNWDDVVEKTLEVYMTKKET